MKIFPVPIDWKKSKHIQCAICIKLLELRKMYEEAGKKARMHWQELSVWLQQELNVIIQSKVLKRASVSVCSFRFICSQFFITLFASFVVL